MPKDVIKIGKQNTATMPEIFRKRRARLHNIRNKISTGSTRSEPKKERKHNQGNKHWCLTCDVKKMKLAKKVYKTLLTVWFLRDKIQSTTF